MKLIQAGPLRVVAAGGADLDGGGDGPAVVLCHGFGAPGDDLVALHRAIDAGPGVRWFFPEAPLAVDVGPGASGRAWWPIDMLALQTAMMRGEVRMMADTTPDGLPAAAAALRACLASLASTHRLDPARTALGGFSQGAMLSVEVALTCEPSFASLVVLSGTLLSRERWTAGAKSHGERLPAFQSHGRRDPILPFAAAESLRDLLVAGGMSVEFHPFPGQHEIPAPVLKALAAFLRARLAAGR